MPVQQQSQARAGGTYPAQQNSTGNQYMARQGQQVQQGPINYSGTGQTGGTSALQGAIGRRMAGPTRPMMQPGMSRPGPAMGPRIPGPQPHEQQSTLANRSFHARDPGAGNLLMGPQAPRPQAPAAPAAPIQAMTLTADPVAQPMDTSYGIHPTPAPANNDGYEDQPMDTSVGHYKPPMDSSYGVMNPQPMDNSYGVQGQAPPMDTSYGRTPDMPIVPTTQNDAGSGTQRDDTPSVYHGGDNGTMTPMAPASNPQITNDQVVPHSDPLAAIVSQGGTEETTYSDSTPDATHNTITQGYTDQGSSTPAADNQSTAYNPWSPGSMRDMAGYAAGSLNPNNQSNPITHGDPGSLAPGGSNGPPAPPALPGPPGPPDPPPSNKDGLPDITKPIGAFSNWLKENASAVTDPINEGSKAGLNKYYDNYADLDPEKNEGMSLLVPAQRAAAEQAAREQMQYGVNSQRDDALRNMNAQMARGGATRSGDTQGVYTNALRAQQEGERGLTQDAFKRRLAASQLGGQMTSDAAKTKYGLMQDEFFSNKDLAAILGQLAPDVLDAMIPF